MTFADTSKYRQPPSSDADISIWCGKDPAVAALAAKAAYGSDATLAVAWCALGAKVDGRATDAHFWFEVFCLLHGGEMPATGFSSGADSINSDGKPH
ncbi:hypothetical protein J2W52_003058 [Rhizobium miluonense]|uniref:Nucleotidyltransferase domain-containing protein n=1 Tax=Rhizobium miluonense TaxID=411945 RepID=A0ABU1SR38_9HYPH|nr:hypothetical protein [Rhizobium miluonense]